MLSFQFWFSAWTVASTWFLTRRLSWSWRMSHQRIENDQWVTIRMSIYEYDSQSIEQLAGWSIVVTRSSRGSHRNREWCRWQSKCTECTKAGDAPPDIPRTHECSWFGGPARWSRKCRAWSPRCCGGTRSHTPGWAPTTALPNRCPASGSALAVLRWPSCSQWSHGLCTTLLPPPTTTPLSPRTSSSWEILHDPSLIPVLIKCVQGCI